MHPICHRLLSLPIVLAPLAAQWHLLPTANAPAPRSFPALAFDPVRGNHVMFGGTHVGTIGVYGETWTFDGAVWTQATPLAVPPARWAAALAFDALRGVAVLHGGIPNSALTGPTLADTWEWNGTDWSQVVTAAPPSRASCGVAYDPAQQRTLVYGGVSNLQVSIANNDTWGFDGTSWQQIVTAHNPGRLQDPAMCFHAGLQRVLLFGGINPGSGNGTGLWSFDGIDWSQLVLPGPTPSRRSQAQFEYDTSRGVAVLFGGLDLTSHQLRDTWVFDGQAWSQQIGLAPDLRSGFAMAVGNAGNVLFGTAAQGAAVAEIWSHDGAQVVPFGTGCPGSNGVPQLAAASGPRLGQLFQATISGLATGATNAAIATGFSDATFAGQPLPLDVTPLGATGCTLYVAVDMLDLPPAAQGVAVHTVLVPASGAILGLNAFLQAASLEPGINPFGGVASNALRVVVGS